VITDVSVALSYAVLELLTAIRIRRLALAPLPRRRAVSACRRVVVDRREEVESRHRYGGVVVEWRMIRWIDMGVTRDDWISVWPWQELVLAGGAQARRVWLSREIWRPQDFLMAISWILWRSDVRAAITDISAYLKDQEEKSDGLPHAYTTTSL